MVAKRSTTRGGPRTYMGCEIRPTTSFGSHRYIIYHGSRQIASATNGITTLEEAKQFIRSYVKKR